MRILLSAAALFMISVPATAPDGNREPVFQAFLGKPLTEGALTLSEDAPLGIGERGLILAILPRHEVEPAAYADQLQNVLSTYGEDAPQVALVVDGQMQLLNGRGQFCPIDGAIRLDNLVQGGEALPLILWLDAQRVVRWVEALDEITPQRLRETVRLRMRGKSIYTTQCARCHGDDGRDLGYPNVKSLDGLGRRLDLDEIDAATEAAGFVDLTSYDDDERRGLAMYVAGL